MDKRTFWIVEATGDEGFPYRLTLRRGEELLLCLRVKSKWPPPGGQIFCIREEAGAPVGPLEEVERVPVLSLRRYGKRLVVVLDRARNKRCDFLFLRKRYKTKEGEYEQIFWRTQRALTQRRVKRKLTTYGLPDLSIIVDSAERYPWTFPSSHVERKELPVGDYALIVEDRIVAVIERKSFENMLAEFGRMHAFHQQLSELETYEHNALVIETNYSDFLNSKKMRFYPPSFAARALGEIAAFHPRLQIVFAGSKKLANEWALRFFSAIKLHQEDEPAAAVAEAVSAYGPQPVSSGGAYFEVIEKIGEMPSVFTSSMLRAAIPHVSESTIRRVLRDMKAEGKLVSHRRGPASSWQKVGGGDESGNPLQGGDSSQRRRA